MKQTYTAGPINILENGKLIAEIKKPGALKLVDLANLGANALGLLQELRALIGEYAASGNEYEVGLCNRIDELLERHEGMTPF
jgi:hypothetical protein